MYIPTCTCFNEMRRKEERSKQGQTNNKAKQHSTPKAVTAHVGDIHVCTQPIRYIITCNVPDCLLRQS